ncbi:MAG: GNAT family N-acetyltransferase [Thermomicrobiales bacterium]
MIRYTDDLSRVKPEHLAGGFWAGWPDPPSPENHLRILEGSYAVWLAVDDETGNVVGFINAISDGVHAAYIPLLEVLEPYQGRGIGSELARRMIASLQHLYQIDLMCDDDVRPFYERLGMKPAGGMIIRNYDRQSAAG